MKVILAGHGHGGTYFYTDDNIGSGWENLCPLLDGHWYELDDAWHVEADVVLYIGTIQSVAALAKCKGKPRSWRKLVLLQEGGTSLLNTASYVADVAAIGFDAFLVYTVPLMDQYRVFGKPVLPIRNAYPFHKFPELRDVPREDNLIALYLQHYPDPTAGMTCALAVVSLLPSHVRAMTWVDGHLVHALRAILVDLCLADRVTVHATVDWPSYLRQLATCRAVLSMDCRMTWGRMDLDAALVDVPCVGPYTAAKDLLFPDVSPFLVMCGDVSHAAALVDLALQGRGMACAPQLAGFAVAGVGQDLRAQLETL